MNIKCGIIGLPNIGKSTLFNILTKQKCKNKNFPFCTINKNIGFSLIKDKNLKNISKLSKKPKNIKLSKIIYIDIAGLIKGSNLGLGLGNKFLNNIKETNIILHIIRIFKNKKIINFYRKINPIKDIKIINKEITLFDLKTLKKYKKKNIINKSIINKIINILKKKKKIKINKLNKEEINIIKKINLLNLKPKIYILNINKYKKEKKIIKKTKKYIIKKLKNKNIITLNIKKYKKQKYIKHNKINDIKKKSLKLLNYITFYTTNENITSSWIIPKNTKIINASKKIHSEFKKKFIKSYVINYKKFIKYNGWKKLKKNGKLKIKGKNYKIKNKDIIYIIKNK